MRRRHSGFNGSGLIRSPRAAAVARVAAARWTQVAAMGAAFPAIRGERAQPDRRRADVGGAARGLTFGQAGAGAIIH